MFLCHLCDIQGRDSERTLKIRHVLFYEPLCEINRSGDGLYKFSLKACLEIVVGY